MVSRVEFKMLFMIDEQVAINMARDYQGEDVAALTKKYTLQAFYDILDDPQLIQIDMGADTVIVGLAALAQAGFVTEARRAKIALGQPIV
jgi:hypothetical protein